MSSAMLLKVSAEFADFGGAVHGRALVKFAAADGARGSGQRADGRADADGEQIAEDEAAKVTTSTNVSAWALSSLTPASSRAFSRLRWATTAHARSGMVL